MEVRMVEDGLEAEGLAALWPEAFEWLPVPASCWWVAEEGGRRAGYSGLRLLGGGVGFSGPTFVEGWARGRGVQRVFLAEKERHARGMGLGRLRSSCDAANVWSANNLIRSGFLLEPCWDARHPGDLYFVKDL